MESVNVVKIAIPSLSHHRQRPRVLSAETMLHAPCDYSVAHCADAVRVGDHDWPFEETGFFHPGCAGHLTIAIKREPGGEHRIFGLFATREDSCHAGAH